MAATFSDAAMGQAAAALQTSQAYQAGDRALAVSESQTVSVAQNAMATAAFSMVKDQVSSFVESSQALMNVLNEVGKVHPFIQIAVSLFTTAIKMELTRRENDDKVLALNATMADMMDVLTMLKRVQSSSECGPDGRTIESRLSKRMGVICESIKRCAKVCDSYQKRNTAIKILTSLKWQAKFAEVAGQFAEHKQALQFELHIHLSVEMTKANKTLVEVNENVKVMMKMVFEGMTTPEEKEIAAFTHGKSIDAVLNDDHALKQILAKQSKGRDEKGGGRSKDASSIDGGALTLGEFKYELNQDIDTVLAENSKIFEQKFSAMELSLKEITVTVQRQSDRVIEEILAGVNAGPHEHIRDKDIYEIWKLMGWKGSVKATHLVMAIHDHFSEKSGAALKQIYSLTHDASDISAEDKLKEIADVATDVIPTMPPEDQWTLEYISAHRVKPLIEAVDDDCSSFASVAEVNAFTTRRPAGWSLPRWIAYWTVGFEMSCTWYYYRIRQLFSLITEASKVALPANRRCISQWIRSDQVDYVQDLLAGLRIGDYADTDWDDDWLFLKFKQYVLDNERKMKTVLRRLSYWIDGDNMLTTVTGGGRPETYALPVIYLLLERALWVLNEAHSVVLHPHELNVIRDSLDTLWEPITVRSAKLRSIFYMQNGDPKEKIKGFCFGLLTYVDDWAPSGTAFFTEDWSDWENIEHADTDDDGSAEPGLYHEAQTEEFEIQEEHLGSAPSGDGNDNTIAPGSLLGAWSGEWSGMNVNKRTQSSASDGLLTVNITTHTQGEFSGEGVDALGRFTVQGQIKDREVTIFKKYSASQGGFESTWTYSGTLNEDGDEISGSITQESGDGNGEDESEDEDEGEDEGEEEQEEEEEEEEEEGGEEEGEGEGEGGGEGEGEEGDGEEGEGEDDKEEEEEKGDEETAEINASAADATEATPIADSTEQENTGSFVLSRKPVEYFMCRPPTQEYEENRAQALWKLVRNIARYWTRQRHLTWDVVKERREKRDRYVKLLGKIRQNGRLQKSEQIAKWSELVKSTHPNDLNLWRSITIFKRLRQPIFDDNICDGCDETIKKTRLHCIPCNEGAVYDTVDLCPNCISETVDRASDNKHHIPSHHLLQIRRPVIPSEISQLVYAGKTIIDDLPGSWTGSEEDSDDLAECTFCNKPIKARPYWCCVECADNPCICFECNNQHEADAPWQLQRKPADDEDHDYMHVLVLVNEESNNEEAADDRLTALDAKLEEKIGVLQDHLNGIESKVTTRLQTLEDLLQHLITTVSELRQG